MLMRVLSFIIIIRLERGIVATRCDQTHLVICYDVVIAGGGQTGGIGSVIGVAEILVNRDVAVDLDGQLVGGH